MAFVDIVDIAIIKKRTVLGKLLIACICALACLSYVAGERDEHTTTHNGITMGQSGVRCTKVGRKCVYNATCSDNKCHCPATQKGNAEIECVDKSQKLCYFAGDPHVVGFSNARGVVSLPCRFRATRFVTENSDAITSHGTCAIEVYATNELMNGRYVIRSVHISVGVTDPALQTHTQAEIYKTVAYNVNDSEIYNYQARVTHRDSIWGSSSEVIKGVDIIPTYDEINNFALLDIPQCETRIKFRANDQIRPMHPPQLPGLTIMAPNHAKWVSDHGDYPTAVCGTPDDSRRLYRNRAEELNILNPNDAILHDVLLNEPLQTENVQSDRCETSIGLFGTSVNKAADINACGFLLTQGKIGNCLQKAGIFPIDAFNGCLAYQQGRTELCHRYHAAANACGSHSDWIGLAASNINCPRLSEATPEPAEPVNFL